MIHWQNHIITLPHSLDLAFLNVASYPVVAEVDSLPSLLISVREKLEIDGFTVSKTNNEKSIYSVNQSTTH